MTGPIQFGGLASGLDTASIIQALVAAEGTPIQLLESQKATQSSKISLLGTLDGFLSTLKDKADELSDSEGFVANSVTGDFEGIASFDSSGGAALGTYTLDVQSLASADRWSFTELDSKNTDVGGPFGLELSFSFDGTDYDLSFAAGEASLEQIAEGINDATDGAVKASVVQTGTDSDPGYVLMVEGSKTGASYGIEDLTVKSVGSSFDVEEQLTEASNAVVEFNGLTLERESNEFTDVVPGLSFTVEGVSGGPVEFAVNVDEEGVLERLNEFVTAYNEVIGFINTQNTYSEEGGPGGDLFGDSVLRTFQSALRDSLFGPGAADPDSAFGSLGLVGIDLQVDGTLTVDEAKIKDKLAEDPDAFADLFVDTDGFDNGGAEKGTADFYVDTSSDTGVFSRLVKKLESLLDTQTLAGGETAKGLIDARKETLQNDIDRMDDRIEQMEFRLEQFEERLVQQFANLEVILGGLQTQGAALTNLQNLSGPQTGQ